MENRKAIRVGEIDVEVHREERNWGEMLVSPETVGSKNMWMGVGYLAPEEEMPSGAHDSEEALLVMRGSGVLSAEGNDIPVKAGTVVYIPENIKHSLRNSEKENMIFIFCVTTTHSGNTIANFQGEICLNCG